jgi:predicted nucleotidyltransferase
MRAMAHTLPRFITDRHAALAALCERTPTRRLALFGSATRADFDPERSDLDFVVTFDDLPSVDDANAFFELKQGLETLFERPVDLLTSNSMRNPYLRQRVEAEQVTLYGA